MRSLLRIMLALFMIPSYTPFPRPTRDMGGKFPPGEISPHPRKFVKRVGGISPPLADFLIKVGEL